MKTFIRLNNKILQEDINALAEELSSVKQRLYSKNILITGSTGLIGKYLVFTLLAMDHLFNLDLRVLAQGRSIDKLHKVFSEVKDNNHLLFIESDLIDKLNCVHDVDYIIHTASPTSSRSFIEDPVSVIESIYRPTSTLLRFADLNNVEAFTYLSSMEVYGEWNSEKCIKESDFGELPFIKLRSSYPQAKRLAELLCVSYAKQKNLNVNIARLGMIYGPGMENDDKRVLNYFLNQILSKKNIKLKTRGESKASVLDIKEATSAILKILLSDRQGEVFNVANPNNYFSIAEIANVVASIGDVQVEYDFSNAPKYFRSPSFLNLDISKINQIGWDPKIGIHEIFKRSILSRSFDVK